MMLRSPLPAAVAFHTASHVSFPLFFFFLTSARGGAATARPLTSPLLARPRPGRGEGRGRPRRERVPRPRGPRECGGEGPRAAAAGRGGGPGGALGASLEGAEPSAPAWPYRPGGGVHRLGAPARPPGTGAPPGGSPPVLSPPTAPPHDPRREAAELRLPKKREIAKPI
ncbi:translation initiation factor IF-2-like [Phacochoerus africanus]|uniref:translation initiation factor IF-2-like n=1 Tax=Phacochoerus africanus TaxID=41426 RepID=UPI001FD9A26C|nr:translation initiation factor IF-2-like [Phacochoerus africanus]